MKYIEMNYFGFLIAILLIRSFSQGNLILPNLTAVVIGLTLLCSDKYFLKSVGLLLS